jgi:disulfide bond formation protein DsbB
VFGILSWRLGDGYLMAYMNPMYQIAPTTSHIFGAALSLWAPIVIMAISVTALATAYTSQYGLGLEPCVLCLYQRLPYGAAILLSGASLFLARGGNAGVVPWLIGISGLAFLAGGGVALYHVGIEQHWWKSAVCGGELIQNISVQDLKAALLSPPPKSCDAIDWTFLGLSMASWNALISAPLAAAAAAVMVAIRRGPR